MRSDSPMLAGHLARHHLEESVSVGRGQRIRVVEVDLILTTAILVVRLINSVTQSIKSGSHLLEVAQYPGNAFVVVARLFQVVDICRVKYANRAVVVLQNEEVLRLNSDIENIPLIP